MIMTKSFIVRRTSKENADEVPMEQSSRHIVVALQS